MTTLRGREGIGEELSTRILTTNAMALYGLKVRSVGARRILRRCSVAVRGEPSPGRPFDRRSVHNWYDRREDEMQLSSIIVKRECRIASADVAAKIARPQYVRRNRRSTSIRTRRRTSELRRESQIGSSRQQVPQATRMRTTRGCTAHAAPILCRQSAGISGVWSSPLLSWS